MLTINSTRIWTSGRSRWNRAWTASRWISTKWLDSGTAAHKHQWLCLHTWNSKYRTAKLLNLLSHTRLRQFTFNGQQEFQNCWRPFHTAQLHFVDKTSNVFKLSRVSLVPMIRKDLLKWTQGPSDFRMCLKDTPKQSPIDHIPSEQDRLFLSVALKQAHFWTVQNAGKIVLLLFQPHCSMDIPVMCASMVRIGFSEQATQS